MKSRTRHHVHYFKLFAHPLSELESIPEESCRLYTVHTDDACRVPRRGVFLMFCTPTGLEILLKNEAKTKFEELGSEHFT